MLNELLLELLDEIPEKLLDSKTIEQRRKLRINLRLAEHIKNLQEGSLDSKEISSLEFLKESLTILLLRSLIEDIDLYDMLDELKAQHKDLYPPSQDIPDDSSES